MFVFQDDRISWKNENGKSVMWYHDCKKDGIKNCKNDKGEFDKRWVIDKEFNETWDGTTGIFGTIDIDTYWPFDVRCCDNKESETDAKNGWYFWLDDLGSGTLVGPFGEAESPLPGKTHISVKRVPIPGEIYNKISKMLSILYQALAEPAPLCGP